MMSLAVVQMKALKDAIDGALVLWEKHELQKGNK